MKITRKKDQNGTEYTYTDGKPDGDFDVVIYYKTRNKSTI